MNLSMELPMLELSPFSPNRLDSPQLLNSPLIHDRGVVISTEACAKQNQAIIAW